jgi:predicted Zn finger-like uncharacterized protein
MLIVCPSCASEYMIDPGRLGAEGRTVRCASCKDTWFITPELEQPNASADAESSAAGRENDVTESRDEDLLAAPADEANGPTGWSETGPAAPWQNADPAASPRTRRFGRKASRFAAGPFLILAGIIMAVAALWGRAQVVRTIPTTAALYRGIGLPVNLRGLEFHAVRSELVAAGSDTFLVVEGEIANISGRDAPVPPIEIGVRSAEGQMLYTWINDPPRERLATSDTAHFRARLAAPPVEARQVLVRFAAGQDGAAVASR